MKTYLIGQTQIDSGGLNRYLKDTKQEGFLKDLHHGTPQAVQLSSFYAKLCYKSLVVGKNENISRVRSVEDNFKGIIDSGHGSVLEHYVYNFVTTGCSRVFTHELVRHRVGSAFSQTSGRFCAIDSDSEILLDPILESVEVKLNSLWGTLKQEISEVYDQLGLNGMEKCWDAINDYEWSELTKQDQPQVYEFAEEKGFKLQNNGNPLVAESWTMPFSLKKKLTSACRRLAPNGQTNEIGWSANVRTLRHLIEMRTSPHAEWEIREVFMEVAKLLPPEILYGGVEHEDGSWTGLRV